MKIAVPLKYLSNFSKSLEMPIINCQVELSLTWNPNWVLCTLAGNATFTTIDVKLYVPIVILSIEDKAKLSKLFIKQRIQSSCRKSYDADDPIRESVDSSCQGISRLFVLAYEGGANGVIGDSHRITFLPSVEKKQNKKKIQH